MRRAWWSAGILICTALAGAVLFIRVHSSTRPGATVLQAGGSESDYVDPATCAGCHPKVAESYRLTGMGRSFYPPSAANTIGDSNKTVRFYHKPSDSYFTMFERDGRLYQRRYQLGIDGKETNSLEKQIDFVLGSGNHARTYLSRTTRNTLVELPLGWYAEKGGYWAMNPGYDRPDHPGLTRNVTYGCMFCHNGIPQIPASSRESGAEPVFSGTLPAGIDCQRCHGPGGRHVKAAGSRGTPENIRAAIVNPARLSPERQLEVCMQCHLETTSRRLPSAIVRYERAPFSYIPGEPLGDFTIHFDEARSAAADDRFQIVSAAYRLRQSSCFRKSEGALSCTTCHNPHAAPRGEEAAQHYTQVCRGCHAAPFDKLVAAGRHTQSAACADCHMPKRRTDDAVHVVMTDHYIQRHKPGRDLLAPINEQPETDANAYRGRVELYYPRELPQGPERDLYLAIAQVSQKSNLKEGVEELAAAIDKYRPESMEYYLQLADAWIDSGQLAKAIPLQEEAVRRAPDSLVALRKLGVSLRESGQAGRSVEVLKRALQVSPSDAATWHQLGLDYLAQGVKSEAGTAFEKATTLDPDMAEAWNSLGGVWIESGDLKRAEAALREAIRIQPDYAEAHSNLGNTLSSAGNFAEASYHFEAAIRYRPAYAAARFNYAVALARVRRFREAQRQVEIALKSDPASPEAHDLLGNLLMADGKLSPAVEQYRQAIRIRPQFGRAQLDLGVALAEAGNRTEALPYLRQAAESPQPAVREEALQTLKEMGKGQ